MLSVRANKIYLPILFSCLICSNTSAEYKELEVLKQSSLEVLGEYIQEFTTEAPKFEGVVNFGQALQAINDVNEVDVKSLTYKNENYWRAVLEMTPRDSSILFAHAHLYAARGETTYSDIYFLLGSLTVDKSHRVELEKYKRLNKELSRKVALEIKKGIKLHDNSKYMKAIEIYDRIISEHPNCALAYYEKGLSYMMMRKDKSEFRDTALQMYAKCRQLDPFHWKAYQGSDPKVIQKLQICIKQILPFLSGKQRNKKGLIAFAEGCEAMELYPFAAHVRWKLALIDSENMQEHIKKFLDLIEKCGCENVDFFKQQFQFEKN